MNEIDKELNSNEEKRIIFLITYIIM